MHRRWAVAGFLACAALSACSRSGPPKAPSDAGDAGPRGHSVVARERDDDPTPETPKLWAALDDAVVLAERLDERWLTDERRAALALLRKQREAPELELDVPPDTPLTPQDVTLPPELLAWKGKTFALWSPGEVAPVHASSAEDLDGGSSKLGSPCLATVTDVSIRSVADPSFELVRSVQADSLAGVVVVGRLASACPGALFASATGALELRTPHAPDGELARLAARAFFAAPERRGCAEQTLDVRVFDSTSERRVVVVTGFDPERDGGFTALFESTPRSTTLRSLASAPEELTARLAVEVDGRLELVFGPDGLERVRHFFDSTSGRLREALREPAFQCPG